MAAQQATASSRARRTAQLLNPPRPVRRTSSPVTTGTFRWRPATRRASHHRTYHQWPRLVAPLTLPSSFFGCRESLMPYSGGAGAPPRYAPAPAASAAPGNVRVAQVTTLPRNAHSHGANAAHGGAASQPQQQQQQQQQQQKQVQCCACMCMQMRMIPRQQTYDELTLARISQPK
jgi:hypothetical protein